MPFNDPGYGGNELGSVEFGGWGLQYQEVVPAHDILTISQKIGIKLAIDVLTITQIVQFRESYDNIDLLTITQKINELLDPDVLTVSQVVINDEGV